MKLDRAKVGAIYFISKGISQYKVSYKAYGSQKPTADNTTTLGQAKNRRIEILILEK